MDERQPLLGGQPTYQYMRPRARRMVIRRVWARVVLELRGGYSRVNQRYQRKVNRSKDFAPIERKESIVWAKMLAQCSNPYTTDGQFTHDMAIKAIESGGENWMQAPQGPPNCPPGLEYLTMIDQLLVHQKVELLEAMTGFETANKFSVKNSMGQKIYSAKESSGCLVRNCCGPNRPFDMKIHDNFGNMVIHLHRPFACQSCCCPCWLQTMEVTAPPGTLVGTVEQDWSIWTPHFSIKDAAGNVVLKIKGPFCTYSLCGDVEFKVLSADGEREVGMISKQWSGLAREAFTDADIFGISFPMDLDVKMKAVMLGACFLIDAMFFEKKGNKETDGVGMF